MSRLRGLSKFQVSNGTLGLSTQELDNILDTVNCLQLVAHRILIATNSEFWHFQAFSEWLRQEIDTQATDPSLSESVEKDVNHDYRSILEYIRGPMTRSQLINLFNLREKEETRPQWDLAAEGRSLFDLYCKEYKDNDNQDSTSKGLPGLDVLIQHLDIQSEAIFSSIAETQRRNVRFGSPIALGSGVPTCMDMRTVIEVRNEAIHSHPAKIMQTSNMSQPNTECTIFAALGPTIEATGGMFTWRKEAISE